MIFNEIYGAYYNAVAKILASAIRQPLTKEEMRRIISEQAFSESVLSLEPSLCSGQWQLLHPDGRTPLQHPPTQPLSHLQKRWLKALVLDPRIRLFKPDVSGLEDVLPLFTPQDIRYYDQYADGDLYEDERYVRHFHLILEALEHRQLLSLLIRSRKGNITQMKVMPQFLEYSEKDDKFRLIASGARYGKVINLGRILGCKTLPDDTAGYQQRAPAPSDRSLTLELYDDRNALERALLHFAHFEKTAERLDQRHYRIKIRYGRLDETEMVIRVLSFGPLIRVVGPECFAEQIKKRLEMQKSCGLI